MKPDQVKSKYLRSNIMCEHDDNYAVTAKNTATGSNSNAMSIDDNDDKCNNHFNDSSTHDTILLDIDDGDHGRLDDEDDHHGHNNRDDDDYSSSFSISSSTMPQSIKEMETKINTLYNQISYGEDANRNEHQNEHSPPVAPNSPRTTITIATTASPPSSEDASDDHNLIQMDSRTVNTNRATLTPSQLELRRRLNDLIYKMQSKVEQCRVEKFEQHEVQKEEISVPAVSSALPSKAIISPSSFCCPLCSHPFPKRTKYNDHTYEYFTCCGTPICAVCHSTFVVRDDVGVDVDGYNPDDNNFDLIATGASLTSLSSSISLSKLAKTSIAAETGRTSLSRTARKISVHCENLLKNHACPFCEEPWSVDEITDSKRILKLAEEQLQQQQQQQQGKRMKKNSNKNIWAQVEIARRYEHGMGVEPNEESAIKWFHIAAAAAAGSSSSTTSKTRTTARTKGEQHDHYRSMASSNPNDVRNAIASAHYHIGRFHKWGMVSLPPQQPTLTGEGIKEEQERHQSYNINDNCDVSINAATGMNVAKHYFLLAAEQSHARAQHDLATMIVDEYYQSERSSMSRSLSSSGNAIINNSNEGNYNDNNKNCKNQQANTKCDDDCEEAMYWYTLSLLQGYDEALYGIGNLFFMRGKMQTNKLLKAFDFAKAIYWLRQSAEKGLARGQMILGMALLENARNTYGHHLYEYTSPGYNIVPEVFYWLRKSSFNGELDAGTRLKNCQNVHLKQCAFCRRSGCNLQWKKCHRCAGVSYCSVACQEKDWECGHVNDCYEDDFVCSTNMIAINIQD